MRPSLLSVALGLSACSASHATPLTETDWTNGQQPCSENRMSFRNGQIAYYPRGSRPLVMFEIVSFKADAADPSLTAVVVKPTATVLQEAQREGLKATGSLDGIMFFRVTNNRLALVEAGRADGSNRHPASPTTSRYFDLIRCPD